MRRLLPVVLCLAPLFAQEQADLSTVTAIKEEAFDHSQVMDHLSYLTDVYGPRLTASPEFAQAADWAVKRLKEYGLQNVHTENWGPFGRSWSLKRYAVEMLEPRYALLAAAPLAWSDSTKGPVTGELLLTPITRSYDPKKAATELDAYKKQYAGKLRGKILLLTDPKPEANQTQASFHRYTDAELAELAVAPAPVAKKNVTLADIKFPDTREELSRLFATLPESVLDQLFDQRTALNTQRNDFLRQEGVLGVIIADDRAHDSLVFAEAAGSQESKHPLAPPTFIVTREQYNRLTRVMDKKTPLRLRLTLEADASPNDVNGMNIVGELPGRTKSDEVVMIGAHFDSWHTGTGATDNAAGSAVMIEVMRILKALNLKLDRTVRIALWSGEEQGLFGSKAYVKEHFGDPKTMKLTTQHSKLAGYFNLDNGSGKIRGVYLQGNDSMRPVFERWLAPFRDQGVTTISIRNTGGTDHLSFDAVGLPGFQFIQDPLDYSTVTHHSNMDTFDHAIPADLMQASAVIATMVYNTANRADMLPRKPLPKGPVPNPPSAEAKQVSQ